MIVWLTLIILLSDIIVKYMVNKLLIVNESIIVIKNFLNITYVKNTGAAWSILSKSTFLIIIISGLIILGIILYIWKNKPSKKLEKIAYSLILGGALGNFINRICCGYVIDFFDINIFGWNYPIFNLADVFIVIGVIILVIIILGEKNDRN